MIPDGIEKQHLAKAVAEINKKAKKGSVTTDNHSRLSPTPLIQSAAQG